MKNYSGDTLIIKHGVNAGKRYKIDTAMGNTIDLKLKCKWNWITGLAISI